MSVVILYLFSLLSFTLKMVLISYIFVQSSLLSDVIPRVSFYIYCWKRRRKAINEKHKWIMDNKLHIDYYLSLKSLSLAVWHLIRSIFRYNYSFIPFYVDWRQRFRINISFLLPRFLFINFRFCIFAIRNWCVYH